MELVWDLMYISLYNHTHAVFSECAGLMCILNDNY